MHFSERQYYGVWNPAHDALLACRRLFFRSCFSRGQVDRIAYCVAIDEPPTPTLIPIYICSAATWQFDDDVEGTGMGEGEGKKDVTDQIEDEEQLLGLKGDEPDKDQAEESKELGKRTMYCSDGIFVSM